ncbi:large conductance mechanosensitive channel protein MscL [Lactobacillus selangorensis]|uniref:large conductance mechanosensitive channel protein MscL n=1 Tax=Lactobacillus selangorensis TaxID=81857 RepID=UPI0007093F19|nr:large conductance mechanosensitive channel protein MscL [Lactobacillus selangorensis]
MLKEFRNFLMQGNVLDMAVGIIVGAAFSGIVKALTDDLINPIIAIFTRSANLSSITFKIGPAVFKIGTFLNAIINFLIIMFVVFLIVKGANKVREMTHHDKDAETPAPTQDEVYLKEIRDLLKEQNKENVE